MAETPETAGSASLAGLDASGLMELGLDVNDSSYIETEIGANTPDHFQFVPPRPDQLARHFPDLEILERIGRGGMGCVYKARQKRLDRIVALKILPAELGADASFAERFSREARALARLVHPNIVTIHDFGQAGGMYFLVMEYMDGMNLRELLEADKLEPGESLDVVRQLAGALEYAHDMGIVHRDVKPENILFDRRGHVKICDFGLVKLASGMRTPADISLTLTRHVMGTPHYMAPEQWESARTVDQRADIYGLGVVFYEMLTGCLPLGHFEPPSKKQNVGRKVDDIVMKALERDPDERYQSAGALKNDLAKATGRAAAGTSNAVGDTSDDWRFAGKSLPEIVEQVRPYARTAGGFFSRTLRRLPIPTAAAFVLVVVFTTAVDWVVGSYPRTVRTYRTMVDEESGRRIQDPTTSVRYYTRGFAGSETFSQWGRLYVGNYMPCIAAGVILLLAMFRQRLGVRADLLTILIAAYGVTHIVLVYTLSHPVPMYRSFDSWRITDGRATEAPLVVGVVFVVLILSGLWNIAARIYRAMENSQGVKNKMRSFYRVMFGEG